MAVTRGLAVPALLCLATAASAQLPPSGFEVGKPFPALQFRDASTGEAVSIQDHRGSKVLVAIFASW
jgi:hypothetical protein